MAWLWLTATRSGRVRLVAPWRRYILFFPEGGHVYAFVESWSVAEGVLYCQVGFTPWSLRL